MIKIGHPSDYDSIQQYMEELRKAKRVLTEKLLVAMRFGLCDKKIVELLKYIWVMLFWAEHQLGLGIIIPGQPDIPVGPEPEPGIEGGPFLLIDDEHFLMIDDINFLEI